MLNSGDEIIACFVGNGQRSTLPIYYYCNIIHSQKVANGGKFQTINKEYLFTTTFPRKGPKPQKQL
jgi:hypothetical protein